MPTMQPRTVERVGVVGAGIMGAGIAGAHIRRGIADACSTTSPEPPWKRASAAITKSHARPRRDWPDDAGRAGRAPWAD